MSFPRSVALATRSPCFSSYFGAVAAFMFFLHEGRWRSTGAQSDPKHCLVVSTKCPLNAVPGHVVPLQRCACIAVPLVSSYFGFAAAILRDYTKILSLPEPRDVQYSALVVSGHRGRAGAAHNKSFLAQQPHHPHHDPNRHPLSHTRARRGQCSE